MYNCSNKLKISEQNRPEKSSPPSLHLPEFIWSKWLISFCLGSFVFPADLSCFRTAGRGVVTMETLKRTTCHQEVLMNICTIWIKLCTNSLMFFSSSSSHSLQPDSVIFCDQEGRIRSVTECTSLLGLFYCLKHMVESSDIKNIGKLITW